MKKLIMGSLILLLLLTMTGCRSGENGEVYVYSYGDYYDPEVVADFEADTGIRVIQDTYDTAEEMYPIIKNGSAHVRLYDKQDEGRESAAEIGQKEY